MTSGNEPIISAGTVIAPIEERYTGGMSQVALDLAERVLNRAVAVTGVRPGQNHCEGCQRGPWTAFAQVRSLGRELSA
jgi:hypothetical protein